MIKKRIKIFAHIHSDFSLGKNSFTTRVKKAIKYKLFSGNVTFFCVGNYLCSLNQKYSMYLPNALAERKFIKNHISGEQFKNTLNIEQNNIIFEIYAWSPYIKGLDVAVDAIKRVNETITNKVYLAIICGSTCDENCIKKFINENTKCSGEEDYLIFLKPIDDVYKYHEFADVLLSPSRSEAFSYVLLEMLSLGKNAIISDIPGQKWSWKYEKLVNVFKANDVDDLVNEIINKINNGIYNNKQLGEIVKKDYSIDDWSNKIIKEYSKNRRVK